MPEKTEQTTYKKPKISDVYRPWRAIEVVANSQARIIRPGKIAKERAKAIVAVAQGVASEHQQKTAIEAIMVDICGVHDISYRSDELGGERDTSFAEGKRFVASQILSLIKRQGELLK